MKHNRNPKDITHMDFDVITLAGKRAGKASASPINPQATLIACKADQEAPVETKLQQFLAACKAFFSAPDTFQYPVTAEVDDDIDDDGDGAADYNAIVTAIFRVSADISAASQIGDDDSRSQAVKTAIDGFLAELDAFRISDDAEDAIEGAEKSTTSTGDEMTDADKAALKAEIEAGLDAKVQAAVKAAVDEASAPLNAKIAEQDEAIATAAKAVDEAKAEAAKATADAESVKAEAEKSAADALAAKKSAEDALAEATTKARSRKAAGGHDDSAPVDAKAAFSSAVKENPNLKISDAVRVLMHGSPVVLPPQ